VPLVRTHCYYLCAVTNHFLIRAATPADATAIAAIYAPHVLHGTASFETEAPTADEMSRRMSSILALGLPYLVAEVATQAGAEIAGYAYASRFRPRAAYARTAENSVYVAPHHQRRGIARALMLHLIDASAAAGIREMVAVIGDPTVNSASVALHRSLTFTDVGLLHSVGEKFGRPIDVLLLQKSLASP
jgi:L-amino acid N-acyltransferase YncA